MLDPNGNVELVTAVAGTDDSGSSIPSFKKTVGGTTIDGTAPNTVTWTNVVPIPTNAIAAAGGTSGIIDNTVATGMGAGASQVHFLTLGNQTCVTSDTTGGCAVQASR
ncbi:MAG: hypothetical protein WCC16_14320 [Candidatus Sulfotelmatobacter sp.]